MQQLEEKPFAMKENGLQLTTVRSSSTYGMLCIAAFAPKFIVG